MTQPQKYDRNMKVPKRKLTKRKTNITSDKVDDIKALFT